MSFFYNRVMFHFRVSLGPLHNPFLGRETMFFLEPIQVSQKHGSGMQVSINMKWTDVSQMFGNHIESERKQYIYKLSSAHLVEDSYAKKHITCITA